MLRLAVSATGSAQLRILKERVHPKELQEESLLSQQFSLFFLSFSFCAAFTFHRKEKAA